jgi:hypothetical protein
VGKKFKTKQKKEDDVSFLPTELPMEFNNFIMSITKRITDGIFRRYFPESVIWRFSEKIQLI